ncbi:FAD-dependent oxidoreductase [Algivirga pacifica]|uniref:Amine oxidase domain-containing protein n=1 Tax=Algivirga pacifica TaxID=1162670 RepID=A0ABP9D6E6_9BACT
MTRKKVAIFGGGIAGLSTAWKLTEQPDWESKYDITIYQMGWRCGGKAGTTIGENGRIEETGVHIFQGWYDHAFQLVKEVYAYSKAEKINEDGAFQSWEDAFIKNPVTLMVEENDQGEWKNWPFVFPCNDLEPGTDQQVTFGVLLKEVVAMGLQVLLGSPYQTNPKQREKTLSKWQYYTFYKKALKSAGSSQKLEDNFLLSLAEKTTNFHQKVNALIERILKLENKEDSTVSLLSSIEKLLSKCSSPVFRFLEKKNETFRRVLQTLRLLMTCVKGVYTDVYDSKTGDYEWEKINHLDFRDWLRAHGATEHTIRSVVVEFLYKGTFGNSYHGETGKVAADIAIRMMLMIPSYKGSFVWNLKGGTGGSFIAPLFVALKHKGVRFEFFHKLKEVKYSDGHAIKEIIVDQQVSLREGLDTYNPIVKQKGVFQWTNQPDYDQLDPLQAHLLKEREINLESHWAEWNEGEELLLKEGHDFDIAVLATSVKPLKYTCPEIIEHRQSWKNMVNHIGTTPTLNVQFWMQDNIQGLGMDLQRWGMDKKAYANTVIYENQLYSWTSMTFVEPYECWPEESRPQQVSYWCGTWNPTEKVPGPFDKDFPERQLKLLKKETKQWMDQHMGWFWPNAMKKGNKEFDFQKLQTVPSDLSGEEKFEQQFFQVNVDPNMEYVIARPGTNKYRLKADETGYANLYFSGDWINFGLNVGYMEGTVIAGLQAAQCILNQHFTEEIEEGINIMQEV